MKGLTVKELKMCCDEAIKDGYENKTVLISCDDEGNGFHTLYFGIITDKEEIKSYDYLFHDNNNPNDVVLLG
jgi:hypothetical protein